MVAIPGVPAWKAIGLGLFWGLCDGGGGLPRLSLGTFCYIFVRRFIDDGDVPYSGLLNDEATIASSQ